MLFNSEKRKVFVYTEPTDMRKQHNGLIGIITNNMKLDCLSGAVFLFFSKTRKACKALIWDGTGLVLIHKKLEEGKFFNFYNYNDIEEISSDDLYRIINGGRIKHL